jgi:hypothetical protein
MAKIDAIKPFEKERSPLKSKLYSEAKNLRTKI